MTAARRSRFMNYGHSSVIVPLSLHKPTQIPLQFLGRVAKSSRVQ
jgi:DNA-directed RNA polymerase subunit K/omega